ncbi:unnamed protein product [Fusarium graminearum]|uniref:Chromosome 2, complete genome n=1 Tax=Gibberella zeae (strain ATCC MYA-4620 / CBS 123657 / FGSC 9075 / NRRL 31084 / PH-1) TaxID=229533 RepID=A0A098DL34_GIBZE|nr:unnamed protein product [Fusarium graminearum]CZS82954.1 unnamed protein product [Fusarium graminearum]
MGIASLSAGPRDRESETEYQDSLQFLNRLPLILNYQGKRSKVVLRCGTYKLDSNGRPKESDIDTSRQSPASFHGMSDTLFDHMGNNSLIEKK